MLIQPLSIAGAAVASAEPLVDSRGIFCRWFCSNELNSLLENRRIVNVNFSMNEKVGTVRGVHLQKPPKAEMKLVRCIRGKVFDFIVDLRKGSPTFLKWCGEILSPQNMKMMIIPEGVAHGFQTLEDKSEMLYLHTEFFSKEHDFGIRYDDAAIGIKLPLAVSEISEKDKTHPLIDSSFQGICV